MQNLWLKENFLKDFTGNLDILSNHNVFGRKFATVFQNLVGNLQQFVRKLQLSACQLFYVRELASQL